MDPVSLIVAVSPVPSDAGFSFLVGCARGIDECFRRALAARSEGEESTFVACACSDRVRANESLGLFASVVVPEGLSPAAALHRRTLWMVKLAELLILFPDDPATGHWGMGSRLAFTAALFQSTKCYLSLRAALRRRFLSSLGRG